MLEQTLNLFSKDWIFFVKVTMKFSIINKISLTQWEFHWNDDIEIMLDFAVKICVRRGFILKRMEAFRENNGEF